MSEPRPLHARIAQHIRADIVRGVYRPGQRLPSEIELARQLNASRGTLRQALRHLTEAGVILTVAGRGSFVPDSKMRRPGPLIGMVLPSVVRTRNPELISGAEETVRQAGGSLMLGISGDERWLETEQIERLVSQGASGLIVYPVDGSLEAPTLNGLVERGFPLVLIDRYIPDVAVDSVTMDNLGGAFQAVQHLAALGYRRIGYVGTKNVGTSSIVERMAGYRWALQELGMPYDEDLVCAELERLLAWPSKEPAKERANDQMLCEYLDRATRPQALFVCNDYVAFQVVRVAEQLGLRIPEYLALVGFDNVAYAEYAGVPLTTVEQPRHEIGATAAILLLERIAGRRTRLERVVVATRLVVRRSSGQGPPSLAVEQDRELYAAGITRR